MNSSPVTGPVLKISVVQNVKFMVPAHNDHGLIDSILYGPVVSRRFGKTLGINILPSGLKRCSFCCLYCQLGSERPNESKNAEFPKFDAIDRAWRSFDHVSCTNVNFIVVSGNGEPTLHPDFPLFVMELTRWCNRDYPQAKLICFTNGSRLPHVDVFKALGLFDECHLKLDARFQDVDLPENDFSMTDTLKCARGLSNLVVQSCFVGGGVQNTDEVSVREWQNQILNLKPKRVDIYTVSRQPAWPMILPVSKEKLEEMARDLRTHGQNVTVA